MITLDPDCSASSHRGSPMALLGFVVIDLLRKQGTPVSPGGGMADAVDSKSTVRKGVRVRIPPRAPFSNYFTAVQSACQ